MTRWIVLKNLFLLGEFFFFFNFCIDKTEKKPCWQQLMGQTVSNKTQVELVKNNGHQRWTAPISLFSKGRRYKKATCLCIQHRRGNLIRLSSSLSSYSLGREERFWTNEQRGEKKTKEEMAVSRVSLVVVASIALLYAVVLPSALAQSLAPAPAPTSDGIYYISFSFWIIFCLVDEKMPERKEKNLQNFCSRWWQKLVKKIIFT